jgi:hypothetical protein
VPRSTSVSLAAAMTAALLAVEYALSALDELRTASRSLD